MRVCIVILVVMLSIYARSQRLEEAFNGFYLGCQKEESMRTMRSAGWKPENESMDTDSSRPMVFCSRESGEISASLFLHFYKNQLSSVTIMYSSVSFDSYRKSDRFFFSLLRKLQERYSVEIKCINYGEEYSMLTRSGIHVLLKRDGIHITVSAKHSGIEKQKRRDSQESVNDILDEY